MILIDANVAIYAYDISSIHHSRAKAWLENAFTTETDVRFGLMTVMAFLRVVTSPVILTRPLSVAAATGVTRAWLGRDNVALCEPTDRHWPLFAELATEGQARGPMLMDAHLAALAIEHGATLISTDRDFARFPGLRWVNPLKSGRATA